jgi:ABC-2 type transport system ATP-binding protein
MLMLLDEPTTGLDPRSKKDVQDLINEIRSEHNASILICTHDMDEAEALCDRIGIIVDGKIVAIDEPDKLKERYRSNGVVPSLEDVFMAATGKSFEDAEKHEEED